MKHKKKMHKAIQRRFDGYLYRSMTDESPMKGTIIFPINNDRRYVYFIKRNGDMKDALKVEYEEGRVSYSGMVWFYCRASKRELQMAYSEYNKRIGSVANGSLSTRVTSYDYGLGSV